MERDVLENLKGTKLMKKSQRLWSPNVYYCVYSSPSLDAILSQLNPVYNLISYSHFNTTLPSLFTSTKLSIYYFEIIVRIFHLPSPLCMSITSHVGL